MIAGSIEMQFALRNPRIFEDTLTALQEELAEVNPDLMAAAPAYVRRIALLQSEIAQYVYAHISSVSTLAAVMPLELQTA